MEASDKRAFTTRAAAAEAAERQGKFWEMHTALFFHSGDELDGILKAAQDAGLDMKRFELDRVEPSLIGEVAEDVEAANAHGIDLVPTLFIRGREYTGTWDVASIQEAIRPPLGRRVKELSLDFASWAAAGSVVLFVFAVIALFCSNSPFGHQFKSIWQFEAGLMLAGNTLNMSLLHWVNDFLMAVFFLVVGLELKREIMTGELADPKRAVLPVAA